MSSENLTGRTLGDFVVRHRLGEGGFGAVYAATQIALGREAVIKVLHDAHRQSQTSSQRFLREARLASQLDHPYAAHVYAFGVEQDGLMWIAMELVKGQTLSAILRARTRLPLDELVPLLDRICEVLQTAHELGIVHRDIKPANVMVVERSGTVFPKLLDFGVAKTTADFASRRQELQAEEPAAMSLTPPTRVGHAAGPKVSPAPVSPDTDETPAFVGQIGGALGGVLPTPRAQRSDTDEVPPNVVAPATPRSYAPVVAALEPLTEAGAAIGSPPYMAPEQWGDSMDTTLRSDLYALGVMAYEALTGRRPFVGSTIQAIAFAHGTHPVPPLGPGFPPALDEVMQKALAKQPEDRYASALELAHAFRTAAGLGTPPLPVLDEDLRVAVETTFPQPIAEAVNLFHSARNAHQARDALRDVATTAIRYIALLALAAHAQVNVEEVGVARTNAETVRELRRRQLRDEEWLRFARDLVAPFRTHPRTHPIPELVTLLHADDHRESLDALAGERTPDPDPLTTIRRLLSDVTRALRALRFLADYPLVVAAEGRAESWMGLPRARRVALEVRGRTLEAAQPALLDVGGRPAVVLWPIVQTSAPMPNAPHELFVLDGGGRRGARMLALPNMLERQDESVWAWLATAFPSQARDTPTPQSVETRPYRGLASFTAQDADAFVGREREIDAAINRLNTSAFLAVVGPSGAGKSSFVHAGIVPALPVAWNIISVRPGATPIATLEARLRRAGIAVSDLAATLARDPHALGDLFDGREATTVLVIDQFEELFALASADERGTFARGLLAAARSPEDNVRVVITLRDDWLARATQLPELRDRLPPALFLLGTPSRQDLIRILAEPLAKQGYDFDDPSLPSRMVDAVADTPGALALLSFSASKLWELRDRQFRQLTTKAYDALGGVAGALAQHAENTLAEMSPNEQRLSRALLGHLVTADGTRAALTRSEIEQLLRDPAGTSALEKLIAARLLITTESESGDDRVEIIHEALLVAWPRLAEWRREDLEGARLRDQVRAAVRQWVERERPRGLLWRDDALAELKAWRTRHPQPLTDAEEAFVAASFADAARGRRLKRGVIGTVIGLMAIAVAILVWARSNAASTAARDRARIRKEVVERGRQSVLAGNSTDARAAFLEARRLGAADTYELRFMERIAAQPLRGQLATMRGHTAAINHVEISPDGTRGLSSSSDGSARLWELASARELARISDCGGVLLNAGFDPTGRRIKTECDDGNVRIYSSDGRLEHVLEVARKSTYLSTYLSWRQFSKFTPDGARVVTSTQGVLEVWDAATGQRLWTGDSEPFASRIAVSTDGNTIAALSTAKPFATLWDVSTGALRHRLALTEDKWWRTVVPWSALAFDPSAKRLYTVATKTEIVQIWDVETGQLVDELQGHAGPILGLAVSGDGNHVAAATNAHTIQVWAPSKKLLVHTLAIGASIVRDLRFSPDDRRLAVATSDGSISIWDVASGIQIARLQGHMSVVGSIAFDPKSDRIFSGGADGNAILWSLDRAATTHVLANDGQPSFIDVRGDRFVISTSFVTVADTNGRVIALRNGMAEARFVGAHEIVLSDRDGVLQLWNPDASTIQEIVRGAGGHLVVRDDWIAAWVDQTVVILHRGVEQWRWVAPAMIDTVALFADGTIAVADQASAIRVLAGTDRVLATWRSSGRTPLMRVLNDKRIVGSHQYAIHVWSSRGDDLHTFAHPTGVMGHAIAHSQQLIATASGDGVVRLWSLGPYAELAELAHPSPPRSLAFGDDDRLLATLDEEGIVRLWSTHTKQLLLQTKAIHGRGVVALFEGKVVAVGAAGIAIVPVY